jgi:deoxyribodipyrimidine photolyase
MPVSSDAALVWFRRDLRDHDHAALYHALRRHGRVYCAFCFDTEILDRLPARADRRVEFLWRSAAELDRALASRGGGLTRLHGAARAEIPRLAAALGVAAAFQPEFEDLEFTNDAAKWQAWCDGRTGYPLVDAAMRQLNQTGYMHNRLRMVAASFLVKDLHVDWRWGERYFAERLNDFDLAANNGGWQWAASTGCDAQPYFRIFNPVTQSERFDPQGAFIRRYVPELARVPDVQVHAPWKMRPVDQAAAGCVVGRDYPAPIVDHARARAITLERYAAARRAGRA